MSELHKIPNIKDDQETDLKGMIYLLAFLFTIHLTPATYIASSFIGQYLGENNVGYVYSIASLITLILFIHIRPILSNFGNYKVFLTSLIIEFFCLIGLSLSLIFTDTNSIFSILFVIAYVIAFILHNICFFNLDIFLEHFSTNNETGGIRGSYLTFVNIAFLCGPFIAGIMISNANESGKIFMLGAILLIPVIYITYKYFNNFQDSKYKKMHFKKLLLQVYKIKDIRNIFFANAVLRFFYSWMIIYTPIFLTTELGFSLGEVGIMIGIALIPFSTLQTPLGKIADKALGEKEILVTGFLIMAVATGLMAFIDSKLFIVWAAVLFITRIGASMVEIMTETYLFKKIDDDSVNTIGLFRALRPAVYIISPIIASISLIFIDIKYLFLILAFIVFSGIFFSLRIRDTL